MCRAQQELYTLVAEAPEEATVVSADVNKSVQTTVSTDLALISNSLAPSWMDMEKPVLCWLASIKSVMIPEAEDWLLGEPPWPSRPEEMSTQLPNTIQMFPTTEEMSTQLSTRNSPSTLQISTKRSLYRGIRCWTWLVMHEDSLPGFHDSLLQPDGGPLLHGDGSKADEGLEADTAAVL